MSNIKKVYWVCADINIAAEEALNEEPFFAYRSPTGEWLVEMVILNKDKTVRMKYWRAFRREEIMFGEDVRALLESAL